MVVSYDFNFVYINRILLKLFHQIFVTDKLSPSSASQIPMLYGVCAPQECSEMDILNGIEYFTGILLSKKKKY